MPLHDNMDSPPLRAICNGHHTIQQKICSVFSSEFTSYSFNVLTGSGKWTIQKRYSDFRELDLDLARKYPKRMQRVLRLPPKKLLGKNSQALVDFRQKALDAYLKSLLKDTALLNTDEIREFLEIPLEAALSDLDSEGPCRKQMICDSHGETDTSQADTSPRCLGVMKVQSWQEEAEVKWGSDLLSPSTDIWAELASGDLLSPRE